MFLLEPLIDRNKPHLLAWAATGGALSSGAQITHEKDEKKHEHLKIECELYEKDKYHSNDSNGFESHEVVQ